MWRNLTVQQHQVLCWVEQARIDRVKWKKSKKKFKYEVESDVIVEQRPIVAIDRVFNDHTARTETFLITMNRDNWYSLKDFGSFRHNFETIVPPIAFSLADGPMVSYLTDHQLCIVHQNKLQSYPLPHPATSLYTVRLDSRRLACVCDASHCIILDLITNEIINTRMSHVCKAPPVVLQMSRYEFQHVLSSRYFSIDEHLQLKEHRDDVVVASKQLKQCPIEMKCALLADRQLVIMVLYPNHSVEMIQADTLELIREYHRICTVLVGDFLHEGHDQMVLVHDKYKGDSKKRLKRHIFVSETATSRDDKENIHEKIDQSLEKRRSFGKSQIERLRQVNQIKKDMLQRLEKIARQKNDLVVSVPTTVTEMETLIRAKTSSRAQPAAPLRKPQVIQVEEIRKEVCGIEKQVHIQVKLRNASGQVLHNVFVGVYSSVYELSSIHAPDPIVKCNESATVSVAASIRHVIASETTLSIFVSSDEHVSIPIDTFVITRSMLLSRIPADISHRHVEQHLLCLSDEMDLKQLPQLIAIPSTSIEWTNITTKYVQLTIFAADKFELVRLKHHLLSQLPRNIKCLPDPSQRELLKVISAIQKEVSYVQSVAAGQEKSDVPFDKIQFETDRQVEEFIRNRE